MSKKQPFYQRLSISTRLAVWYGLSLFVMLSIFAFFLYESFHQAIHHNYDRHLQFEARQLMPHIDISSESLKLDLSEYGRKAALNSTGQGGTFVKLFDIDGDLIFSSPNYRQMESLPVSLPDKPSNVSESRVWEELPARLLYLPLNDDQGQFRGWLVVTGFEWTLHESLNRLGEYLIIIILISVFFSITGGYWLSKRALRPVAKLTGLARSIKPRELYKRLPVNENVDDELTELARTFNAMLDRLQRAFEREKRFTSDAAHELLTPLASLRSEVEITLRRKRDSKTYRESLERTMQELQRMDRMVQLLLELSRVESGREFERQIIDFRRVLEHRRPEYEKQGKHRELSYEIDDQSLILEARPTHIEEIVDNLVNNAIKYTAPEGRIMVRLTLQNKWIKLVVEDDGFGIGPDDQQHLFDRFYRSGAFDIQARQGSGLGLPLVKAIVDLYGGSIHVHSAGRGQGSRFEVYLPAHTSSKTE